LGIHTGDKQKSKRKKEEGARATRDKKKNQKKKKLGAYQRARTTHAPNLKSVPRARATLFQNSKWTIPFLSTQEPKTVDQRPIKQTQHGQLVGVHQATTPRQFLAQKKKSESTTRLTPKPVILWPVNNSERGHSYRV